MGSRSFHTFIYARNEQCDLGPIYTITNTQRIRIYPGKLKFILAENFTRSRTFTWQTCQRRPNSVHVSYCWEFIRTPLFTQVQIPSVFKFVQLCCKFTRVNAFTPLYKRVGAYLGNYLSTFFCVLSFIRIDPNLHIASKRIKLIPTNIYKVLQFIRVNLPGIKGPWLEAQLIF